VIDAEAESSYFVAVNKDRQLLAVPETGHYLLLQEEAHGLLEAACDQYTIANNIQLLSIADASVPDSYMWLGLRELLGLIPEPDFYLAGRALQLSHWLHDHQFCGRCGQPTEIDYNEPRRVCKACNFSVYPRISPCVIGVVTRGDYCLLAKNKTHRSGMFSTLAGFIEAGETAEQAFAREVKEEVGIAIDNIRYVSSQPWPFPGQLMLGFEAEYAGGDIVLCEDEIAEADWFHFSDLPIVPSKFTIAGQLLDRFVNSRRQD